MSKSYCSMLRQQVLVFDQHEGTGFSFSPAEEGVFVMRASDFAAQHGLKVGDLIVAIDSVPLAARVCGGQAGQEATFHERLRDGAVLDVLDGSAHQTEPVNFRCPECWRGFDSWQPCLQHHLAAWRMEGLEKEGLPAACLSEVAELQPSARDVRLWMRRAAAAARDELSKPLSAGVSGHFQGLPTAPEAPPLPAFGQWRRADSSSLMEASTLHNASVSGTSLELQQEIQTSSKDRKDAEGGIHLQSAASPQACTTAHESENDDDGDSSGSEVCLMGTAALKQTHAHAAPQETLLPSPSLCSGSVDNSSKEVEQINQPEVALQLLESKGAKRLQEQCFHTSQTSSPDAALCTSKVAQPMKQDPLNQASHKTMHTDDQIADAGTDLPSDGLHSAEDAGLMPQAHMPDRPPKDCKEGSAAQEVFAVAQPTKQDLLNQVLYEAVHTDDQIADAAIDLPSDDLHSAEDPGRRQQLHVPDIPQKDCKEGSVAQDVFAVAQPTKQDLLKQVSHEPVHTEDQIADAAIDLPSDGLHSAEDPGRRPQVHVPDIPPKDCNEGSAAQKVFGSGQFHGEVACSGNSSKLTSIGNVEENTHCTLAALDASCSSNNTFQGQGAANSLVGEAQNVYEGQEPLASQSQEPVSMPQHSSATQPALDCDSSPVSNSLMTGRNRQVVVADSSHEAGMSDSNNQVSVASSWQSRRRRSVSRKRSVSRRRSLSRPLRPTQPHSWWDQFWEMRRQRMRGRARLSVSMPQLGLQDLDVRSFTHALDRLLTDLRSEPRQWGRGGTSKACRLRVMLELDMSDNNLGDAGAICLCQWLLAHRQEVRCRVLRLSRNAIGDDALEWLAKVVFSQDSAIEVFHLSQNHVTESGAMALLLSIATHPSEAYPWLNRNGLFAPAAINLDGNHICKPEALFAKLHAFVGFRACLEETYMVCTRCYTACPHVHVPGLMCADTLWQHASHATSLSAELLHRIEEVCSGGRRNPPAVVGVLALPEQQLTSTGGLTLGSTLRTQTHRCALYVDEDYGAGLELEPVDEGLRVVEVFDYPGQTGLQAGDVIVAIDTWPLSARACPGDDEQNCRFGRHFRHGVCLDVHQCQRSRKAPTLPKTGTHRFRCPRCSEGFATWQPCLRHLRDTGHGLPLRSGAMAEDPAACARRWMNDCVAAALSSVPGNLQQEQEQQQVKVEWISIPGLAEGRRCSALLQALTTEAVRYCDKFSCVLWTWPTGLELRLPHNISEGAPSSTCAVTGLHKLLSFYLPELEATRASDIDADEPVGPADWTAWLQSMLEQDEDAADAQHDLTIGTPLSASAPPFIPRSVADTIAGLRIVVLCGLPGSGKSTLAEELSHRLGWSVVNQDTLGSRQACMKMARACLKLNERCVVIDRCNIDLKQRSVWVQLAMHEFSLGVNALGCICLDASVEECEQRVMRRFGHSTLPAEASSKAVIHGFAESWQPPSNEEGFVRVWRMNSHVDMETLWAELLVSSGHDNAVTGLLPQQALSHLPLACQQTDACSLLVDQLEVIPLHDRPQCDDSLDVQETAVASKPMDPAASCGSPPEATDSERAAPASGNQIAAVGLFKQASSSPCRKMDACLPSTSQHKAIPLHNLPQHSNFLRVRERAAATGPKDPTESCGMSPETADPHGGAHSMDQSKPAARATLEMQPSEFWRLPLAAMDISGDEDSDDLSLDVKRHPAENLAVGIGFHAEVRSKTNREGSDAEATGSQTGNEDASTRPAKPDVIANFWRLPLPELHDDLDEGRSESCPLFL